MDQLGAPSGQCFTVGSDQATVNRLADIADTCSVDMLVPEAFSCAVCLELMVCPISCFPCRHSFCEPCVRLITHAGDPLDTLCPICRQAILCCAPNNALKNQILHVDPLMTSAYERRMDWFRHQEAFHEMRLPGIAGLGILPKIGAWLPGGNGLADYLVRTLFGLITGRGAVDICRQLLLLYQQLYAFTFSVVMFLLIPCIYLRTVLKHPLPSSTACLKNDLAYLDALFNTSSNSSSDDDDDDDYDYDDDGYDTVTNTLPFQPFGTLSGFPFIVLCLIVFLCACRVAACLRIPPQARAADRASYSRAYITCCVAYYLSMFPALAGLCVFVDFCMTLFLFDFFSYWTEENCLVASLQFTVCTFALAAYWIAMLLATAACFKLDTSRHIGSWKCFRVLMKTFLVYYVTIWLVLIALDCYYNFLYHS